LHPSLIPCEASAQGWTHFEGVDTGVDKRAGAALDTIDVIGSTQETGAIGVFVSGTKGVVTTDTLCRCSAFGAG
jgi:hypothetical protein